MRTLILNFVLLSFFGFFLPVHAQKLNYSVFIGGNYNFISQKSDYEIMDKNNLRPALSYSLGGNVKTNYKNINILGSIEYTRISNRYFTPLLSPEGYPVRDAKLGINNHYTIINSIGTVKIGKGLYVGAGLSGSFLLWSSLKVKGGVNEYKYGNNGFELGDNMGKVFRNPNYRKILISIPVIVGYEVNRINVFTRLNMGLMSRIKGDSFVKEIENTLICGIGYKLNKNE